MITVHASTWGTTRVSKKNRKKNSDEIKKKARKHVDDRKAKREGRGPPRSQPLDSGRRR